MRASSGIKGLIFAYEQHPYVLSEWSIRLNGSRLWSLRASSPRDQQGGSTICLMEGVFLAPGARNSTPQSVKWRVSGLWGRSLALTFGLAASPQNPTTLLSPLSHDPFFGRLRLPRKRHRSASPRCRGVPSVATRPRRPLGPTSRPLR